MMTEKTELRKQAIMALISVSVSDGMDSAALATQALIISLKTNPELYDAWLRVGPNKRHELSRLWAEIIRTASESTNESKMEYPA